MSSLILYILRLTLFLLLSNKNFTLIYPMYSYKSQFPSSLNFPHRIPTTFSQHLHYFRVTSDVSCCFDSSHTPLIERNRPGVGLSKQTVYRITLRGKHHSQQSHIHTHPSTKISCACVQDDYWILNHSFEPKYRCSILRNRPEVDGRRLSSDGNQTVQAGYCTSGQLPYNHLVTSQCWSIWVRRGLQELPTRCSAS